MGKGSSCFYCEFHCNGRIEKPGWSCDCSKEIDNSKMNNGGIDDVLKCEKSSPQYGFQIGGYYSHMTIQAYDKGEDPCFAWTIKSNGEFPTNKEEDFIEFHICNFEAIEEFIKVWKKILKKRRGNYVN